MFKKCDNIKTISTVDSISGLIFALTIASVPVSFWVASLMGEPEIFGIAGILRYSWFMWLFVPISIVLLVLGKWLKINGQKYKKNYIAGVICLLLLLTFGSYRFIFSEAVSYDVSEISVVNEKINLQLPSEIKTATNKFDNYKITYAKITDDFAANQFENEIKNNNLWKSELDLTLKGALPLLVQPEITTFDIFLFYNTISNKYNSSENSTESAIIFVAYDFELQKFLILAPCY